MFIILYVLISSVSLFCNNKQTATSSIKQIRVTDRDQKFESWCIILFYIHIFVSVLCQIYCSIQSPHWLIFLYKHLTVIENWISLQYFIKLLIIGSWCKTSWQSLHQILGPLIISRVYRVSRLLVNTNCLNDIYVCGVKMIFVQL